jgi:hypothetical protein
MPIHITTSTTQSLSNKTFVDRVSTTGVVYASSGNSNQWSSAYSSVYATSATWDSTYTSLNTNSAKYDSVYTTTNAKSANWDSTYNTVNTASGSWAAQTLAFDESTAILSITNNGNTVSLSALSGGSSIPVSETDPIFTTWAQANSAKYESTYTTVSTITGNLILGQLGISIDGGGSVITTGVKQYLRVPYNCTITSYELVADRSGSLIIDVDKSTYDTFSLSASIAGSSLPTLSNESKSRSTDLAGWGTTTLTAGEYLFFDVTSAVDIQKVTLTLATRR